MNVTCVLLLVSILITCSFCQKNDETRRMPDDNANEISDWGNDPEEQKKNILTSTPRDISSPRTIIPSFRMILLEVSFMAISIYLVNSLENYIQQKSKTVPKSNTADDDLFENFRNILSSFDER